MASSSPAACPAVNRRETLQCGTTSRHAWAPCRSVRPLPRFPVPTLVQILSWAIPSGILLVLMGLRAATKSAPYRKDLQGAIGLIVAHLVFRGILLVLPTDEITA